MRSWTTGVASTQQQGLKRLENEFNRGHRIRTVTAATTVGWADDLVNVNAAGGAITVTLPPVANAVGQRVIVKKVDSSANMVTVDGNASETIDGSTTIATDVQYVAFDLMSDGTTWHRV